MEEIARDSPDPLALAAWIAAEERPSVTPDRLSSQLDALAESVQRRLSLSRLVTGREAQATPLSIAQAVSMTMFGGGDDGQGVSLSEGEAPVFFRVPNSHHQ